MVITVLLSVVSAVTASGCVVCVWRLRHRVHVLRLRYADTLALLAVIARTQPPLVHSRICEMCEELLNRHDVTARVSGPAETIHY